MILSWILLPQRPSPAQHSNGLLGGGRTFQQVWLQPWGSQCNDLQFSVGPWATTCDLMCGCVDGTIGEPAVAQNPKLCSSEARHS